MKGEFVGYLEVKYGENLLRPRGWPQMFEFGKGIFLSPDVTCLIVSVFS